MHHFLSVNRYISFPIVLLFVVLSGVSAQQFDLDSLTAPESLSDFGFGKSTEETPLTVHAEFTAPNRKTPAYLFVTVKLKPKWHIYSTTQTGSGPIPTQLKVAPSRSIQSVGKFSVSPQPKQIMDPGFKIMVENHYGTVTWFAPLKLSPGVDLNSLKIRGSVFAQPCKGSCLPPENYSFVAKLSTEPARYAKFLVAAGEAVRETPKGAIRETPKGSLKGAVKSLPDDGETEAEAIFSFKSIEEVSKASAESGSLLMFLVIGFVGGLILNLMPCVLPVIGLKVLSFIEQAGHDRRHAFMLNLWYSLGLMSVFMVLATLAVVFGFGWGELFRYSGMNITLVAVVFVMALSFLGIWEVPIPGFVGSGKADEVTRKEGAVGAFAKGVLTTILATPCSAPFLATALTWALAQPPLNIYAVFTAVGFGMASPYLLIGAFPKLIKFLPKPGAWMETFKEVMGFVLLGTVIFILTFIPEKMVVPTVTFLFGLWGGCWWIGRTNPLEPLRIKALRWGEAVVFSAFIWLVAFSWLGSKSEYTLPWKPYSEARLEQLMNEKQTVLIDFTADWCATCKTFEAVVLNTETIYNAVKEYDVATLKADWTSREDSKEVDDMLKRLGSKQVPVIVVIPDGNPKKMSIFRGSYTKADLIGAIEK